MENKMIENKTEKETTPNSSQGDKSPSTETTRPVGKRRTRRRLPAW